MHHRAFDPAHMQVQQQQQQRTMEEQANVDEQQEQAAQPIPAPLEAVAAQRAEKAKKDLRTAT